MQKILIKINKNSLVFSYLENATTSMKNLLNTNVISNNKLVFSTDYILQNTKIVSSFLKEIWQENKGSKVYVNNMKLVPLVCKLMSRVNYIDGLAILEEVNFTYEAYESIVKYHNVKIVNCYSIPTFMIELFDREGILVESRAEILFTSNFMNINNLGQYSKIYYKMAIRFNLPITDNDLSDFDTFCKINKYLKVIHLDKADIEAIEKVVKVLIKNRIKNVRICLHDNVDNKDKVDILRKLKKAYQHHKIYLSLNYTDEYIEKNYLKQVVITTLSYSAIIALVVISCCVSFIYLNNKRSEDAVKEISENIKNVMDKVEDVKEEVIDTPILPEEETPKESVINEKLASLLELNNETVGWLTVPGTNIDYPIVQAKDNSFYLDHNFNKEKDFNGWVFMNYYNNPKELDRNTIIFAHNRFYSGVMFGTLNKLTKSNWYDMANENLITFNTLYQDNLWEVFSIYEINVTDDYLQTSFNSDSEWLEFVNMLQNRSIFKSNKPISTKDKIITLSTCLENNKRLVVHAVINTN